MAQAMLILGKRPVASNERNFMKPVLLSLALIPLLLTGCATSGYYSDYPGYYYNDYGYDPGYYGGPVVGFAFDDRDHYHHGYHHYDSGYHHGAVASNGSFHSSGHFAGSSVSHVGGGGFHGSSASVSSGAAHIGGGGGGHGGGHR
jgi:hypothetical protein